MKPCDCESIYDIEKLESQIHKNQFKKFAEWYLENQD